MAEVFGVVSGAVGAAGVAFQFAEGIRKLYQFCKDIRDAPEEIRDSLNQLQLLSYILDAIAADLQKHPARLATHAGLPAILEACRQGEIQMATLLKEVKLGMDRKKKLASFKAVWRKDELKKFVDRVERAKTSLLLAQTVYSSGQINMGFSSSNARMDQLELAVISSTATINQNVSTALAQSTAVPGHTGVVGLTNRDRNTAISSSSRWRAKKRPSDRVAHLRLPFLLQRSWELAVYRASGGWHVSLTASRIVPDDSPFLEACRDADIVKVRAMLTSGEATSRDTDQYGRNSLFVCIFTHLDLLPIIADGMWMALFAAGDQSNKYPYLAICQLLLQAGADVNIRPIHWVWNFTLDTASIAGPEFLRLLVSHEDIGPNDLELGGYYMIPYLMHTEAVEIWQNHMWPPWRERSLNERIRCMLASGPLFKNVHDFKLWIYDPPEDIWTQCGELSDELLVHMLHWVVRTVLNCFNCEEKDARCPQLKKELALWSGLISYGLKDRRLDSVFWMTNPKTPIGKFFADCHYCFHMTTQEDGEMLFHITNFLYILGVDIAVLGRVEQHTQSLGILKRCRLYSWSEYPVHMIGFESGPKPEDWKIWWSNPRDEWAGDFWKLVEGDEMDQAEKDMPGTWPDSEDDSSDSD